MKDVNNYRRTPEELLQDAREMSTIKKDKEDQHYEQRKIRFMVLTDHRDAEGKRIQQEYIIEGEGYPSKNRVADHDDIIYYMMPVVDLEQRTE